MLCGEGGRCKCKNGMSSPQRLASSPDFPQHFVACSFTQSKKVGKPGNEARVLPEISWW